MIGISQAIDKQRSPYAAIVAYRRLGLALPIVLSALPALAQQVADTDSAVVCADDGKPGSAYSRQHRTFHGSRPGYEHDHIVPLCLGGADSEANLQWQPLDEARQKDQLERFACI